ncbi:MAG: CDP-alcohol phosphatidyltransferase family protein [Actinomycetota bacterium]|nr:CDP-alcohol phosphatidyltransferase family protein [Actinomycetota bacterium]
MLQRSLRVPVAKIIAPLVKTLVKVGVSANMISAMGGVGAIVSALYFFPKGKFFSGVVFVCIFVLFDLFDGAVARQSNTGVSKWGALLDSTLDRLSDAAILLGAMIYYIDKSDPLVPVFLVAACFIYGLVYKGKS